MKKTFFDLTDGWFIAKDEKNEGMTHGWEKEIVGAAIPAAVPSIIQQFFPGYHGLAYYWCRFTPTVDMSEGDRTILRFGGVDYKADVWLNGVYLGADESGETPFSFDATDAIKIGEENLLAVRVLNPTEVEIDGLSRVNTPHRNKGAKRSAGSSLNHGGIWYGVHIDVTPASYIADLYAAPNAKNGEVDIELTFGGESFENAVADVRIFKLPML